MKGASSSLIMAMGMLWIIGCGEKSPVSSITKEEGASIQAKLVVSADSVAGTCENPPCRPGFETISLDSKREPEPDSLEESVLRRSYSIKSQETLDELAALGGESFAITGDLKIQNTSLVNLAGLENLTRIEGKLIISENKTLVNVKALNNLIEIGGNLIIMANPALTSLVGLENLTHVGGDLIISCVDVIECRFEYRFCPFGEGIDCVPFVITCYSHFRNSAWELDLDVDLDGDGDVDLDDLFLYADNFGRRFDGPNLSRINTSPLNNLTGLDHLSHIDGDLIIWGNDALVSLAGLESLAHIGGDLMIRNNRALPIHVAHEFADKLVGDGFSGEVIIE